MRAVCVCAVSVSIVWCVSWCGTCGVFYIYDVCAIYFVCSFVCLIGL